MVVVSASYLERGSHIAKCPKESDEGFGVQIIATMPTYVQLWHLLVFCLSFRLLEASQRKELKIRFPASGIMATATETAKGQTSAEETLEAQAILKLE